jgi:hypothetical protein
MKEAVAGCAARQMKEAVAGVTSDSVKPRQTKTSIPPYLDIGLWPCGRGSGEGRGGGREEGRGSHDGGAETCRRRCSEAERATDAAANPS